MRQTQILLTSVLLLAACSTHKSVKNEVEKSVENFENKISSISEMVENDASRLIKETDDFWIGDIGVDLEHGVPFGAEYASLTISHNELLSLQQVTSFLAEKTKIPFVILDPEDDDANKNGSNPSDSAGARIIPPSLALRGAEYSVPRDPRATFRMDYEGSMEGLVELVANHFGYDWIHENGRVRLFKDITDTYEISSLPGSQNIRGTLSTSTSPQSGGDNSFQAGIQSDVTNSADVKFWVDLENAIQSIVGKERGEVHVNQSTGSVTVRAHRLIHKKIKEYVINLNHDLEKVAVIEVQILKITISDEEKFGFALRGNYLGANDSIGYSARGQLPSVLSEIGGGSIQADVVSGSSPFAGSNAVIEMLNQAGSVQREDTLYIVAKNHIATPFQSVVLDTYLAAITESQVEAGRTSETLTPGNFTVGLTFNVLADIKRDSKLLIQLGFTASAQEELRTFGSGNSGALVQQPKIASTSATMQTVMNPGETMILTGLNRVSNDLAKKFAGVLGVSSTATQSREMLLVLMTPMIKKS